MKNSFINWLAFCIALGVLFFTVLVLVGMIDVDHKERLVLLVLLAGAIIYMNFRKPKGK